MESFLILQMLQIRSKHAANTNTDADSEIDPIIDEEAASFRPALFGTSQAIAMDVSRLPRLDQYNSIVAGDNSEIQTPSDIKTLSYFFSTANPSNNDGVQFTQVASGGLYRRQVDRAVASYAGDLGLAHLPMSTVSWLPEKSRKFAFDISMVTTGSLYGTPKNREAFQRRLKSF